MKKINTLLLILTFCIGSAAVLNAQTRYLNQVFAQVTIERNVTYARNVSVLTSPPAPIDLRMDVYRPAGDTATNRPVVIYLHTGSFLPPIINGQVTGSRLDSTVVEMCTRLAKMGYVAIAATYRQGWNPVATGPTGQDVRTGTLLNATYRGVQDVRSCIRFLRKGVAENANPYGIDTEKIVVWGQGTGGYLSLAAGYLDRFSEIILPKFINTQTLQSYIDTNLVGDVYGLQQKTINLPNHVGYSSDFKLAVNMGGALGDSSWIEGRPGEPAVIAYHFLRDPFAPFANGAVIVPTTGDFVVNVSGSRVVVGAANAKGSNAVLAPANTRTDAVTLRAKALSQVPIPGSTPPLSIATDNFYPFLTEGTAFRSGLWEWWDKATFNAVVAGTNMALGSTYNADTIHNNSLITNPNMSKALALTYVDTILKYYAPRACAALNLGCALTSTVELLDAKLVDLKVSPNPSNDAVYFQSAANFPIQEILLLDVSGRVVQSHLRLKENTFTLRKGSLPPGIYFAKLRFEKGIVTQKLVLTN